MKKAYELGVLCDAEVALVMITPNRRLIQYSSTDMDQILLRYTQHGDAAESRNNNDVSIHRSEWKLFLIF